MIDPDAALRLAADSLCQSTIFALLLKALLSATSSWQAAKRYQIAVCILAAAILAPLGALLPEWQLTPPAVFPAMAGGAIQDSAWVAPTQSWLDFPTLRMVLLLGWAAGTAICLFRTAKEALVLSRIATNADMTRAMKFPGVVVAASSEIRSPIVVGYFRQAIIVPHDFEAACPQAMRLALLAHEQAHLIRKDTFAALGQRLLAALLWWNPALHWINAQIDEAREMACDEIAAKVAGDPALFAAALVSQARHYVDNGYPQLALGVAAGRSRFGRRVEHLLKARLSVATACGQIACFGVTLLCLAAVVSATPRLILVAAASPISADNSVYVRTSSVSESVNKTAAMPRNTSRHFSQKPATRNVGKVFPLPPGAGVQHEAAEDRTATDVDYAGITARYQQFDALTARYQVYDAAYAKYESQGFRHLFSK